MILNKFGTTTYGDYTIPNLFVNLGLTYDLIKSSFTMLEYTIVGAPRPEQLSYKLYGTTDYEWVLLLVNNVIDPWYGWINEDDVIRAYADKKYATFGGATGVHHYVDPNTGDEYFNVVEKPNTNEWYNTLDSEYTFMQFQGALTPVTNVEHEMDQNELLRKIKVVSPVEIKAFVSTFERVYNGSS